MAHIHKKSKDGRGYYYVREIARVNGKPKVVNQVYLGTAEKLLNSKIEQPVALNRIQVQEFGALWLANEIEKMAGVTAIIDECVPQKSAVTGPSVGEYFLYAAFNRMADSTSKHALADWYAHTAIQSIRPVDVKALDSAAFWRKWEKVDEQLLRRIAKAFFEKIAQLYPSTSGCFLFDTTVVSRVFRTFGSSKSVRLGTGQEPAGALP